jgi:hypothetical protein
MPQRPEAGIAVTRRQFLACCSALATAGCASVTSDTRSAYALLTDPPLADYERILEGLVHTVLPLEQPVFPVTGMQVKTRLLDLFRLERDPRFLLLQRSFVLFDQTDLFPHFAPLANEEQRIEGGEPQSARQGTNDDGGHSDDSAHDRELYARFANGGTPLGFTSLSLDRQREYFDLWRRSRFLLRREFHATARSLIMITAYSMSDVWAAIGYAGPLLSDRAVP